MNAAFAHVRRASSIAQVVALGQSVGRVRGRPRGWVSGKKSTSGSLSSKFVSTSFRAGLFPFAFWALRVRNVIVVCVEEAADGAVPRGLSASGLCIFLCVKWASRDWVGSRSEDYVDAIPCGGASSGWCGGSELVEGEGVPCGECGKGKGSVA